MNPVNATSLYVSASRSVLQCDPRDPRALAELCKLLPFFRQSLSCLVCGNLLQDPIAPTDSSCQHYVCRGCKGQRMQLKPSCSWCKDYSRFQENRQLSLLVHCYRKLCLYIAQSPLAPHIAGVAGDSPDLQAILDEGLTLAEGEQQDAAAEEDAAAVDSSDGLTPHDGGAAFSEVRPPAEVVAAAPPPPAFVVKVEDSPSRVAVVGVNGLHDCNGLAESDAMRPIAIETGGGGCDGGVLKSEVFEDQLPVCVSVTAGGGDDAGLCEITAFGEELKHSGGSLLLSVEEVLRTLETADPDPPDPPDGPQPDCDPNPNASVPHASLNGPHCPLGPDSSRHTPSLPPENSPRPLQPHPQPSLQPPPQPASIAPRAPSRCHRKRSRSESDSEKVQPLPIASLLRGGPPPPPLGANNNSPHHHQLLHHHHHHHHLGLAAAKREPKFPCPGGVGAPPHHHPHLAPVPNGGPPKVGKTVLVSSKGLKKAVEHHGGQKKAYAKARQGGVPKPRAQPGHARMPPHPHSHPLSHPPSPSKPLYKKPVEKKGCKCGRATQNPSVLTCRGQRCPCYSNRKACLDCICRGCQNSYMANGEKKLEAFAVPEKALEQTRLTLGINLTSITAAALRSPAAGAPGGGNALINVAAAGTAPPAVTAASAFISGAGHDSRAFDDSLEMRFDC